MPGYWHKMVLCSHIEYPICDCVHSYSISPRQTSILKHELGSENKAVDCLEHVPENKGETLYLATGTVPEF